jgi:DNA-binding PadR family transcriptional regulator
MSSRTESGLSALEYHVLLAVADGPVHGYAVRDAVEREAQGALTPRAGTLYRVIARLMAAGFVAETEDAGNDGPHPGRARRYYELSGEGRRVLADETRRLKAVAALADERLGVSRP